jgi:hypothetical protein
MDEEDSGERFVICAGKGVAEPVVDYFKSSREFSSSMQKCDVNKTFILLEML